MAGVQTCALPICHILNAAGSMQGIHLGRIQLPPGFKIRLYARDVPTARSLAMRPRGIIFVGPRHAGKVDAVLAQIGRASCRERV